MFLFFGFDTFLAIFTDFSVWETVVGAVAGALGSAAGALATAAPALAALA